MRTTARRLSTIALLLLPLVVAPASAQEPPPARPQLAPDRLAALDRISSDSLKGHLSFLASDLLEGRDTPSKGLDLAAEYIAAQFRRAGLEPVGDDGYFQTANWEVDVTLPDGFSFGVSSGGQAIEVDWGVVLPSRTNSPAVPPSPIYKVAPGTAPADLDVAAVAGRVVLAEAPAGLGARGGNPRGDGIGARLRQSQALLVVYITRQPIPRDVPARLIDPKNPGPQAEGPPGPPSVLVNNSKLAAAFDAMPAGPRQDTAWLITSPPARRPVKLRNVAGLLRGSDPALKDTYVMVTAHYDHLGIRGPEGADRIFNGANDDGSGTVSVIEVASALATLKDRPKRSLLFVTFFGEEKGLLGSRYYGRNPLVPVDKTVADVNLEQVGRTDDSEGPRVGAAALTGFGYSDVSKVFVASGEAEGVQVTKHPRNSDAFFGRSDNQALADLGVPAHTLCVAFAFPDYHGAADHWDKVDYANLAKIDRMVARTLLTIADDPVEPKWDEANPRAAKYLKAWKDRRGK